MPNPVCPAPRLLALTIIIAATIVPCFGEPEPVSREAITPTVTRVTFPDGTVKLDVQGRGRNNPVTFVPGTRRRPTWNQISYQPLMPRCAAP